MSPINQAELYYLFADSNGNMYTPSQFLHFNDGMIQYKWINVTSVRGVSCNWWRTCLYVPVLDATMYVDWYFSGKWSIFAQCSPQNSSPKVLGSRTGRSRFFSFKFHHELSGVSVSLLHISQQGTCTSFTWKQCCS